MSESARPVADETIASLACLRLKVAGSAPIPCQHSVRNAVLDAMAGNGLNLARRLRAKPMVDGHGFNREFQIATMPKHHVKAGHRIAATGHGHAQPPWPIPREGQSPPIF